MIKINNYILTPTIFPDGTSQVWKLPKEILKAQDHSIIWNFEHEREIIDLLSLNKLLNFSKRIILHIPYLPYARQDKEISNDKTWNLRLFANLINRMECDLVTTVDVHNSELTENLFINFKNIEVGYLHEKLIKELNPDYIVYPDLGAKIRYKIDYVKSLVFCKTRDQLTGNIIGHEISHKDSYIKYHAPQNGEKFLIIDDIIDGGATFISLAKKLRKENKDITIYLFGTHGIFSKGRSILHDAGIEKIFTTNSLLKNFNDFEV